MASVLGKMLMIDIRVRPAPISSIVTRISPVRHLRVRRAIIVGEAVADDEGVRGIDLLDLPVRPGRISLGPGHVVLDPAAWLQVVLGEGRRVGRRAPPPLELARVRPELPYPLG